MSIMQKASKLRIEKPTVTNDYPGLLSFINVNGTFCVVASLMLAAGDWLLRNALNLIISYQANIHAVCLTGLLGEKGVTF